MRSNLSRQVGTGKPAIRALLAAAAAASLCVAPAGKALADISTSPTSSNPVCVDNMSYSAPSTGTTLSFQSGSLFQTRKNDRNRNAVAHYQVATDEDEKTGQLYLYGQYVFKRLTKNTFAGPSDKNRPDTGEFIANIKGVTLNVNGKPVTLTIMVRGALKNQPGYGNTHPLMMGNSMADPSPSVPNSWYVAMIDRNGDGRPDSVNKLSTPTSGPAVGDIALATKQLGIQVGVSWINDTGVPITDPSLGTTWVNGNEFPGLGKNCIAVQIRVPFNVNVSQWAGLPSTPPYMGYGRRAACAFDGGLPQFDVTMAVNDGGPQPDSSNPNQSSTEVQADPTNGVFSETPPALPIRVGIDIRSDLPAGQPNWVGLASARPIPVVIFNQFDTSGGLVFDASTLDASTIRLRAFSSNANGAPVLRDGNNIPIKETVYDNTNTAIGVRVYFSAAALFSQAADGGNFSSVAVGADQPATLLGATNPTTVHNPVTGQDVTASDQIVANDPSHPETDQAFTLRVDPTAPTIASMPASPNGTTWYNANVPVTFTATDGVNQSGIESITYSATGAQPIASTLVSLAPPYPAQQTGTASVTITAEGSTVLTASTIDVGGNGSAALPSLTINIDKTAPVTTPSTNPAGAAGNWIESASGVTVMLAADDSKPGVNLVSGVNRVEFWTEGPVPAHNQGSSGTPVQVSGSSAAISITDEGVTVVHFHSVDNATNAEAWQTIQIQIDNTAPTITAPPDLTVPQGQAFSLGNPTVNDTLSGVATVTNDAVFPFQPGVHYVTWTVTDKAGNSASAVQTVTIVPVGANLEHSAYQMMHNPIVLFPSGFFSQGMRDHNGVPNEGAFMFAPAMPALNSPNWTAAPNADTIGYGSNSRSVMAGHCGNAGDYTFFQTLLSIPNGTNVTSASISFQSVDDGIKVWVFNSTYPNGVAVPGFAFYPGPGNIDLTGYLNANEVNRIVLIHVDDCYGNSTATDAIIRVNGNRVPLH